LKGENVKDIYSTPFLTYWPTSFSFKEAFYPIKNKKSVGIKNNLKLRNKESKNIFDFLFMGF